DGAGQAELSVRFRAAGIQDRSLRDRATGAEGVAGGRDNRWLVALGLDSGWQTSAAHATHRARLWDSRHALAARVHTAHTRSGGGDLIRTDLPARGGCAHC